MLGYEIFWSSFSEWKKPKSFKVENSHIFLLDVDFLSKRNNTFGKSLFHLNSSKQMDKKIGGNISPHRKKPQPMFNGGVAFEVLSKPVWIKVENTGIKKWSMIIYFNSSMSSSMCAILTGSVSRGCVEMVFWSQTQDISACTWADASEFSADCMTGTWHGCGRATHTWAWTASQIICLTVLGWDVAFCQSSVLPLRKMSINPLPHYSWNQSRNSNCFLPPRLVHTGFSKNSLEPLWSLTWKDTASLCTAFTASLCTAFKVWFNSS